MKPHPYRKGISGLDFDDLEQCRNVLLWDSHNRVEGLCSEVAFMEDIVHDSIKNITGDFWFYHGKDKRYIIIKMLTSPDRPLSSLDYTLLDKFASSKQVEKVGIAYFVPEKNQFKAFGHSIGKRHDSFNDEDKIWNFPGTGEMPDEKFRARERIINAGDFLRAKGILREAAIKRIFANCVIGQTSLWDIDAFIESGSTPIALEIKHKYPAQDQTFGVNIGQAALFRFLIRLNIPVFHFILKKPMEYADLPAVDLLTDPRHIEKSEWLYKRIYLQDLSVPTKRSRNYTSYSGENEQEYYPVPAARFKVFKKFKGPLKDLQVALTEEIKKR